MGGRGWGGGDKNVIHIASMPKALVFTAFPPLQHMQGCGTRNLPQASIPFATMPKTLVFYSVYCRKNTGICSVFASLYNMLGKDVEQKVDV